MLVSHQCGYVHNACMTEQQSNSEASVTRPVQRFRNRLVTAAVWENQIPDGVMYSVTFDRTYRFGDEWRTSTSFASQDLVALAKVALEAHTWIGRQRSASHVAEASDGTEALAADEPDRVV